MKSEHAFNQFLQEQIQSASGRRLERLQRDLVGEKKMCLEVLWPVFQSFDGFTLEHELKNSFGVSIYVDAFYHPMRLAFESEGFVPHADNITRDRFSFERSRIRALLVYGYRYVPFSWDELDKSPEACRRSVYELIGRYGNANAIIQELSVYERELIRYAIRLNRPFSLVDCCVCIQLGKDSCRKIVRKLMDKKLVRPSGTGRMKIRRYELEERALNLML